MNFIKRIKERKELKKPINIVINSNYDYHNHDINVLKACLNAWSKNDELNLPYKNTYIKYDWIYTNKDQDEKLYFIQTSKLELMNHSLEILIDNDDFGASSYMPSDIQSSLYSKFIEAA